MNISGFQKLLSRNSMMGIQYQRWGITTWATLAWKYQFSVTVCIVMTPNYTYFQDEVSLYHTSNIGISFKQVIIRFVRKKRVCRSGLLEVLNLCLLKRFYCPRIWSGSLSGKNAKEITSQLKKSKIKSITYLKEGRKIPKGQPNS